VSEKETLRVHLEFGEAKADFEGDVNQVFESIVRFLIQIYPNLEILQKIVYTPNLSVLTEKLVGVVEISSEGPILVSGLDLPSRDVACIALLGAHAGSKLGKLSKETLSSSDLARITGKARKTISNEIPRLVSDGLVERTVEGEYRITILGVRKAENAIEEYKPR
jgi:hypothetical protein